MLPIEEAIIEKLGSGPCHFNDVASELSNFSWSEVLVAVECMSRDGRVPLLRLRYAIYQLPLGSQSGTQTPVRRPDVERVER
jgi:hypothetical protein